MKTLILPHGAARHLLSNFATLSTSLGVVLLTTLGGASLTGCNSTLFAKTTPVAADENRERLRWLEKDLKRKEAALQEMRERNLVLERRAQGFRKPTASEGDFTVPIPFDPSAAGEVAPAPYDPVVVPQAKPPRTLPTKISRAVAPLTVATIATTSVPKPATEAVADGAEREQTGEQRLYSKVLETYRKHNLSELQKSLQFLLKTYPDSVYADNALYTAGLLAMELGDVARSHYYMNRVVREYPRGNKTVSALFAIAMIEKRKNKLPQAQSILKSLERLYPGSPEAARAATEMKLFKKQASRSREG